MADTSNLSQFLTDVADAIRTKKETTEPIPAANFDTEILSIETGSQENLQEQLDAQDLIIQQLQEELSDKAIYDCNYYNARLVPTNGKITSYITEISKQLDTSSVTNMQGMFSNCTSLTTIPQLDTSNVTTMNHMFSDCTNLTTIPELNTGKVTDMSYMFYSCSKLEKIDITKLAASIDSFAFDCYSLKILIIRTMDKIPSLSSIAFNHCYHFYGTTNETYNPEGLKDGAIYVPDDKVEALKVATNWSTFADIIKPLSEYVEE